MFRLDRLLTLYLFSPLRKLFPVKYPAIPILMYHSISDSDEHGSHPYYKTCTSPRRFAQQMSWLHEHGYKSISIVETMRLLSGTGTARGKTNDVKYCAITFDDGFKDFYTDAFPILAQHGFTATVFLPTSFISDVNMTIMDKTFLSWPQVRELIKAGITFGSHSVTHKHLDRLPRSQGVHELQQSKATIEDRTGSPVQIFSFPYAFMENDKDFISFMHKTLKVCGYSCAVTTRIGTAASGDDPFSLRRIPANTDDDLALFEAKMASGYDWMHAVQFTAKYVKTMLKIRRRRMAKWTS